jgi:hypothetical protein
MHGKERYFSLKRQFFYCQSLGNETRFYTIAKVLTVSGSFDQKKWLLHLTAAFQQ